MGAKTIGSVDVMKYFSYYLLYTKRFFNTSTFLYKVKNTLLRVLFTSGESTTAKGVVSSLAEW